MYSLYKRGRVGVGSKASSIMPVRHDGGKCKRRVSGKASMTQRKGWYRTKDMKGREARCQTSRLLLVTGMGVVKEDWEGTSLDMGTLGHVEGDMAAL